MNKEKTIIFLAHSQSLHTQRWVDYFIKNGWKVYVISFHSHKIPGAVNINFNLGEIDPTKSNYKYLLKLPQIIYYIYKYKPTILNSSFLSSFGLLGFLTFRKNHIINLHGSDVFFNANANSFRRFLYRLVLKKAKHIFSVSDYMTKFLVGQFRVPLKKITTLQYGVNTEIFKKTIPYNKRVYDFITNRNFVENSNYHFLLHVFAEIHKQFPATNLLIVGSGPLKPEILKLIHDLNLASPVTVEDRVPQSEMIKRLNSAKIFLSFTRSDGAPLSLFEAVACGLYPILSDNPSNREWVSKGMQGTIIQLGDLNSTVKAIVDIYKNVNSGNLAFDNTKFINTYMNYNRNMKRVSDIFHKISKIN